MAKPAHTGGLSVGQGAALSIGAVLGTGVITLPALAADIAGPASLLAWAGLVVLSIPLASTFAAMGSRFPNAGGVSTYVRVAFGDKPAVVVGWCFFFAVVVGAPPAALMAGAYVADAAAGGRAVSVGTAAGLIAVVAALNAAGLRLSGRVQLGLTSALALLMLVTIAVSLPHAQFGNLTPFAPHGLSAIGSAAALLVWGFAGWEAVASLSADYRRPDSDVPRATALAVGVVAVLYLGLATVSLLVLGAAAGSSRAPLSELMALRLGGQARTITSVVAVLLTLGAMNAYFAGGARLAGALGRDGAMPLAIAGSSARGSVLRLAGLGLVALGLTSVAGIEMDQLMLLTTGSFTAVYVLGCAAAVKLLPRRSKARVMAAVALVCVLGLLVLTGWHLWWTLLVAAAAVGYQIWHSRRHANAQVKPRVGIQVRPDVGAENTSPSRGGIRAEGAGDARRDPGPAGTVLQRPGGVPGVADRASRHRDRAVDGIEEEARC